MGRLCPDVALLSPPQYDEHVISPKEFVHLAGKSTLKDWKRAIRMNGIMLRSVGRGGGAGWGDWAGLGWGPCVREGGAGWRDWAGLGR